MYQTQYQRESALEQPNGRYLALCKFCKLLLLLLLLLAVGQGSSQACNLTAAFRVFFFPSANFTLRSKPRPAMGPHLNVWDVDISAAVRNAADIPQFYLK